MADPTHLAELLKGVESWNAWREAHPEIEQPDLSGIDYTADEYMGTSLYDKDGTGNPVISLRGANFQGAFLVVANLQGAQLNGAILQGANLGQANLKGARLRRANLQDARLEAANFQDAYLVTANLQRAELLATNLQGANLEEVNLEDAVLVAADMQAAHLNRANLHGAALAYTNLHGALLEAANLQGATLNEANLEGAVVTGVLFSRGSRQRSFQGIRVSTCYGNQIFKSFAQDQDYIETLRSSGRWGAIKFWIWYITSDCGRSFLRWGLWSVGIALLWSLVYYSLMGPEHIKVDHLPFSLLTMIYYSVVTFTTLGFGDIKPATETAAMVVMAEVILGYIMLGGLIAILANKVARRS